jgi:hypothetical protein
MTTTMSKEVNRLQVIPVRDVLYSVPSVARMRFSDKIESSSDPTPDLLKHSINTVFGSGVKEIRTEKLTSGEHNNKGVYSLNVSLFDGAEHQLIGKIGNKNIITHETNAYKQFKDTDISQLHVNVLHADTTTHPEFGVMLIEKHGEEESPTFRDLKKPNVPVLPSEMIRFQRRINRITRSQFRSSTKEDQPEISKMYSMQREEFPDVVVEADKMIRRLFVNDVLSSYILRANEIALGENTNPQEKYMSIDDMLAIRSNAFDEPYYTVTDSPANILDLDHSDKNFIFNKSGVARKIDLEMTAEQIDPAERIHVENKHIMGPTAKIEAMGIDTQEGNINISFLKVAFSPTAYKLEKLTWKEIIPQFSELFEDKNFSLKVLKYRLGSYLHESFYAKDQQKASLALLFAGQTANVITKMEKGDITEVNPKYLFEIPGMYVNPDFNSFNRR